jgi:hypothetical protein
MEITFSQEDNVYRMSVTRGQKIYQKIVTEQDFTSLYVDISELQKCFSGNGGKVDEHTTCSYKIIESADTSAIEIELEIRFQKSPKMKVAREEFSFMLPVIHRDAQLEEIVRLKKECATLTKKVRLMESYQMSSSYYDHRYISIDSIEFNGFIYFPLGSGYDLDLKESSESSYIWKHKRFLKYQSMFKLNEKGRHYYDYMRNTSPENPGEHASQEQKDKYQMDSFMYRFISYFKCHPFKDISTNWKYKGIYLRLDLMKILSQKYEKMAQYHAEI